MADAERAHKLRGAAWESIVVAAIGRLRHEASTELHRDCHVYVDGHKIVTRNDWEWQADHPYVASIDGAAWNRHPGDHSECRICSCKASLGSLKHVDVAFVRDVWEQTGQFASAWLAIGCIRQGPESANYVRLIRSAEINLSAAAMTSIKRMTAQELSRWLVALPRQLRPAG